MAMGLYNHREEEKTILLQEERNPITTPFLPPTDYSPLPLSEEHTQHNSSPQCQKTSLFLHRNALSLPEKRQ